MRYILDKDELEALVPRADLDAAKVAIGILGAELLKTSGFTCIHDRRPLRPAYNHTRGDSALTPCPECKAAADALDAWGRRGLEYCDFCPIFRLMYPGGSDPDMRPGRRLLCERPKNVSK